METTEAAEGHTDRLARTHDDLVAAIQSLTTSEDWVRMLALASRFSRYSANNLLLILYQRPDATRVAGYRVWQALGRQVRKGERGIRILAPCRYRNNEFDDGGSDTTHLVVRGFTTVTVFDVSQTDGDEIVDVLPTLLDGDDESDLWTGLSTQVHAAGYAIERGDCSGANGYTDHRTLTVRVRDDVSGAQASKTLAHELAHVLLHTGLADDIGCRGRTEVEAESVAYMVCHASGLATGGYSFPYIAHWSDGSTTVIRDTAERVLRTSRSVLDAMAPEETGTRNTDASPLEPER
jgi:antirestriction protein ArdC